MVYDKIKEIIVEQLGVEEGAVTLEANIQEDLGADSLDVYQIMISVEEELQCELDSDRLEKIHTVGELLDMLEGMAS